MNSEQVKVLLIMLMGTLIAAFFFLGPQRGSDGPSEDTGVLVYGQEAVEAARFQENSLRSEGVKTYVLPDPVGPSLYNVLVFTEEGLHIDSDGEPYVLVYVQDELYRLYLTKEVSP